MNVVKVHLIMADELDLTTTTPPGVHARIELGHTDYLDFNQEHAICYLTWAAASVQIVGTVPHVLDSLERAISDYASRQVAS